MKIDNLSEAEKLDRFVRALVSDVRMQVELRGPVTFHDVALYAERADAILSRVTGHDSKKNWQKKNKSGYQHRPPPLAPRNEGETNAGPGPEPMEISAMRWKPLSKEEYQ